jgi:hypothetical protein
MDVKLRLSLRKEHKLREFEKVLRRKFELKKQQVIRMRKLHNEELHNM